MLSIESIGQSIEGREINLLKINAKNSELPLVFIDAGDRLDVPTNKCFQRLFLFLLQVFMLESGSPRLP